MLIASFVVHHHEESGSIFLALTLYVAEEAV